MRRSGLAEQCVFISQLIEGHNFVDEKINMGYPRFLFDLSSPFRAVQDNLNLAKRQGKA